MEEYPLCPAPFSKTENGGGEGQDLENSLLVEIEGNGGGPPPALPHFARPKMGQGKGGGRGRDGGNNCVGMIPAIVVVFAHTVF